MTVLPPGSLLIGVLLLKVLHSPAEAPPAPVRVFVLLEDTTEFQQSYTHVFEELSKNSTTVLMLFQNSTWTGLEHASDRIQSNLSSSQVQDIWGKLLKPGRKILYVIGDFETRSTTLGFACSDSFLELPKAVCGLFQNNSASVSIRIVFPEPGTQATLGNIFKQQWEREPLCQAITVHLGVKDVKLYVGLDQNDRTMLENRFQNSKSSDEVVVQYEAGNVEFFSFDNNFWVKDTSLENEFQQKIREAERVTIFIDSSSRIDSRRVFKVGEHSATDLADTLINILGTKEHPHQRVKVRFPKPVLSLNAGRQFINHAIGQMHNRGTDAYGKEPSVTLYLILDMDNAFYNLLFRFHFIYFPTEGIFVVHYRRNHGRFFEYNCPSVDACGLNEANDEKLRSRISEAEELSIVISPHGNYKENKCTHWQVAGKDPDKLACIIGRLLLSKSIKVVNKRVEVKYFFCNAESKDTEMYTKRFLSSIDANLLLIKEVIALNRGALKADNGDVSSRAASGRNTKKKSQNVLGEKNSHGEFSNELKGLRLLKGKFTTRTTRNRDTTLVSFPTMPAEEYKIYKLKSSCSNGENKKGDL